MRRGFDQVVARVDWRGTTQHPVTRRGTMTGIKRLLCLGALVVLGPAATSAHDGHTDPILAELNDDLMAIQVLRLHDSRASVLFDRWRSLSEASWKIRDLTEQQDLSIEDPGVQKQIAAARELKTRLRDDCRAYFASLE